MTRTSRPQYLRVIRAAIAVALVTAFAAAGSLGVTSQAGAAGGVDTSVTLPGSGDFSNLKVTVSQTQELTNQVVSVSWTGGAPTEPSSGSFYRNYLSIMQCWGDASSGPDRSQCQYGGLAGDTRGGTFVTKRQVNYGGPGADDPAETIKPQPPNFGNVYVPFKSVTGVTVPGDSQEFFDSYSTNEIPFGRTRADGSGQEFVEVQTALDAPGLGCGTPVVTNGSTTGRACWLVVVPRGDTDVNGVKTEFSNPIYSSPLVASAWAQRIVFPLTFQPIGAACKIGASEVPTLGQEQVAEAVSRWQPKLCETSGSVFGYSQVSDDAARNQLLSPNPGLSFVSRAIPKPLLPSGVKDEYAPVAVSGLTFAFNIDSRSPGRAPPEIKKLDGQRITTMNLSARVVAKLLTQSYRSSLPGGAGAPQVASNTPDLTNDQDFLKDNPSYSGLLLSPGLATILTPVGNSDVAAELWAWITSDKDARAFLNGQPDPYGMRVNPNYKGIPLPLNRFPKNDLYCSPISGQPDLCVLDFSPYTADFLDGARSTGRGDTQSRNWDPNAQPPSFKKSPPQLSGARIVITVTTTAAAARYQLPTAKLKNASGAFVAPTTQSLLSGLSAMSTGSDGLLQPNPASKSASAYPLTSVTYAGTIPSRLTTATAEKYAAFIDYAVTDGQTPGLLAGQLPEGYAPLPDSLAAQAQQVAKTIVKESGQAPGQPLPPTDGSTLPGTTPPATGPPPGTQPAAAPPPEPATTTSPSANPVVTQLPPGTASVVAVSRTVGSAVGAARFAALAALVIGGLAAVGGPLLLALGRPR